MSSTNNIDTIHEHKNIINNILVVDVISQITMHLNLMDIFALSTTKKSINKNLYKVYNTSLYWKSRITQILNISLNNQKNTDKVDWCHLCKKIELKGFGKTFIDYSSIKNCKVEIDLLLSDSKVCDNIREYTDTNTDTNNDGVIDTPLSNACKVGNLYACQKILLADIEDANHYRMNDAAEYGHTEIITFLIEQGVDPSLAMDFNEITPLDHAVLKGHIDVIKILLKDKRLVPYERTLYYAIHSQVPKIVKLLLKDGRANPNTKFIGHARENYDSVYPLEYAARLGNIEITKLLLFDARTIPNIGNNIVLITAIENNNHKIVRLLYKYNHLHYNNMINMRYDDDLPLRIACSKGHMATVKCLLSLPYNRVDPACCANDCIIRASSLGHINIVNILLKDNRVNPTDRNNLAIRNASKMGHKEVVKLLLTDYRVDCLYV
jgi:ankyrin repeat protein